MSPIFVGSLDNVAEKYRDKFKSNFYQCPVLKLSFNAQTRIRILKRLYLAITLSILTHTVGNLLTRKSLFWELQVRFNFIRVMQNSSRFTNVSRFGNMELVTLTWLIWSSQAAKHSPSPALVPFPTRFSLPEKINGLNLEGKGINSLLLFVIECALAYIRKYCSENIQRASVTFR